MAGVEIQHAWLFIVDGLFVWDEVPSDDMMSEPSPPTSASNEINHAQMASRILNSRSPPPVWCGALVGPRCQPIVSRVVIHVGR